MRPAPLFQNLSRKLAPDTDVALHLRQRAFVALAVQNPREKLARHRSSRTRAAPSSLCALPALTAPAPRSSHRHFQLSPHLCPAALPRPGSAPQAPLLDGQGAADAPSELPCKAQPSRPSVPPGASQAPSRTTRRAGDVLWGHEPNFPCRPEG